MSTTTDETRSGQLDIETIREFLMRNPDFVREDAELFARVTESPSTEGVIDIGNAATPMTEAMPKGVPQANGERAVEPVMDVEHVAQ